MSNLLHHTLRGFLALSALTLGLLAASVAHAADVETKGEHFGNVAVPAGLAASDIKDAIVATLLGRQWSIKSKADGDIVGYLKHRSNEATVTLTYDTSNVEIYCVGFKVDKTTGAREKPEQPRGWLKNIEKDLAKNLNKARAHK